MKPNINKLKKINIDDLLGRYGRRLKNDDKFMPATRLASNGLDSSYALYAILTNNSDEVERHLNSTISFLFDENITGWDAFAYSIHKGFRQCDIIQEEYYLNGVIWNLLQVCNYFWETLHEIYDGTSEDGACWTNKYYNASSVNKLKNK